MSQPMSQYDELLEEFEVYARSAAGVKSLMQHIADRLHEAMTKSPRSKLWCWDPVPAASRPRCVSRSIKDCAGPQPGPGKPWPSTMLRPILATSDPIW